MKLFEDQELGLNMIIQAMRQGFKRPMFMGPTGYGKTVVMGEIIKRAVAKGNPVAFIVDRLTLVDQASAHLDAIGIDHGVIQSNHPRTDYSKMVQVISAQTLARRKPWEFKLGLVDEAHCMHKGVLNLMKDWDNIPFIGFSATPFTKGLGNHYDTLIKPITISELIENNRLVDADAFGPSKPDMTGVKTTAGDFNQKQAAERADQDGLIANIVETWQKLANDRQTICFATNVAHSEHIVKRFQDAGVAAVHIDAYTDSQERREAISKFKTGEVRLLSSVGVLTTGFDAPNAEVAILARPTKSLSLHLQMIGRILRMAPGKPKGLILDHAGNIERLGFHTDSTPDELDDGKKQESKLERLEKEEKLPTTCPQCFALKPANTHICPYCGFAHKKPSNVEEREGELKKLQRKTNKNMSLDEKIEFMGGLKWYANQKGYKSGWVAHKYEEKTGVWPNDSMVKTAPSMPPNEMTKKYIQYINIKSAKRRSAV